MYLSRIILLGRRKYLFGLVLLLSISAIFVAFGQDDRGEFDLARTEVLLRRIGHEVLLQSGDSTSRVLPLKKIAANEYEISFENKLTFQTDSLVNTTQRLLSKDKFISDYVVTVRNCGTSTIAYGYAISKNKKDDIVACLGRRQPKACYKINIKFKADGITNSSYKYIFGGFSLLAFVGFIFLKSAKPKREVPKEDTTEIITFGSVIFDVQKRQLTINGTNSALTGTETRLLLIFALAPNEIIERSRLQKELWEDEGVIVGRSLDMFISKLRKKLEPDPTSALVVVRNKGYKLEVTS